MTRAQGPDDELDYSSAGAPGASRVAIVLRTGSLATVDPDPAATAAHDLRVVLVHLEGPELDDPPAFGGETPAGSTASALARIADREHPGGMFAIVAERDTCAIALSLAADLHQRMDHLVLVAPEIPIERLERDLAVPVLERVRARALLVAASTEPATVDAADWYARHLADASTTVLSAEQVGSPDGRLGLGDAWIPVLAHLRPLDDER
jgi:pimeloyl-ACP methyl ester carboxylesterase